MVYADKMNPGCCACGGEWVYWVSTTGVLLRHELMGAGSAVVSSSLPSFRSQSLFYDEAERQCYTLGRNFNIGPPCSIIRVDVVPNEDIKPWSNVGQLDVRSDRNSWAIDFENEQVIVLDGELVSGAIHESIYKVDCDGGNLVVIKDFPEPILNDPNRHSISRSQIIFDSSNNHIYFPRHAPEIGVPPSIWRIDANGDNMIKLCDINSFGAFTNNTAQGGTQGFVAARFDIDLDGGYIFVNEDSTVTRMDLDGGNAVIIADFPSSFTAPSWILADPNTEIVYYVHYNGSFGFPLRRVSYDGNGDEQFIANFRSLETTQPRIIRL